MISPRTGRRARAPRYARGAVVFALALGLITAPHVTVPTTATASTEEPEAEGVINISLTTGLHGVIELGSPLTATVSVENGTDQALAAGRVSVELNTTPLTDTEALTSWLDAGTASGSFTSLGTEASEAVAASESSSTSISATAAALGDLPAGVYPIRGFLTGDPTVGTIMATSVLVVDTDATRQITVIVPITATPADGALLTADELAELTAPEGSLTAQLDGVAGTSGVIAVDPLIPAAIRALGTAAPATASAWLTRLESLSNDRFALQPGDADATVQARASLPELLTPLPLAPFLDEGNFVEGNVAQTDGEATPAPSPSPSPTPAEPEIPSDDELMAIRGAEAGILWPTGDAQIDDLSAFDSYLAAAQSSGGDGTRVQNTGATTILPSTALASAPSALVDIDGHRVLAMDAGASAILSEAAAEVDDAAREREIATAIAQLTYADAQNSVLVGLDRNETRSADALRETILSLSAFGQPTGLDGVLASAPESGALEGETSTARADALETLLADEKRLTAFSSILEDPLVLLSPERIEILRIIGVGTADEFAADTSAHRIATTATLDAVAVQQPSPIQLFTAAAPLPVWVRNDLPWPVNVTLTSQPSDARLDVQPSTPVEAQPASNTRVKVPVEARVGSGVLDVRFELYSPTGVHIGTDQTATVTVRAEWEGIGLGILGSLIGLLLVLGVVRTILRRRKERRADTNP